MYSLYRYIVRSAENKGIFNFILTAMIRNDVSEWDSEDQLLVQTNETFYWLNSRTFHFFKANHAKQIRCSISCI